MKLNLGCGLCHLTDYINIDRDPSVEPDVVADLTNLPYEEDSVEQVVMYHTIEHIPRTLRPIILQQIHKVLKMEGEFVISFPEFWECAQRWKDNVQGMREFWEATLYGRQSSPADYHVAIMDSQLFSRELINAGFRVDKVVPEPQEPFNTVIKCYKTHHTTYEKVLTRSVWQHATK